MTVQKPRASAAPPHSTPAAHGAKPTADMQAVVVIHGMGEQIPMDTIKRKSHVAGFWRAF